MKIKIAFITILLSLALGSQALAQSCTCLSAPNVGVSCTSGIIGLAYANVNGGKSPYTYSWIVYGGTIINGQGTYNIDIFANSSSSYIIAAVTVTDACNRSVTKSCSYSAGWMGPSKTGTGLDGEATVKTVEDTMMLLEDLDRPAYRVAFEGVDFLSGMTMESLMAMPVFDIIDAGDLVTLVLGGNRERMIPAIPEIHEE